MSESTTTDIIESQQEWLDPLAETVQGAVAAAYESAGDAGRQIENALHGTWLGHPLHSALTDVPLGAWTSALVMDAMEDVTGREEFGTGADAAVAIGLTGAVAAAAAGLTDWHKTDGTARRLGLTHGLLNIGGAVLYAGSLAARRSGARSVGRGLSTLGFVVAMGAAYLGGKLVYGERIGTEHSSRDQLPDEFVAVLADSELAEGDHRKVDANGTPVLLARRNGQVLALGNTCPHLGGPLNEGVVSEGAVKCPWHGSRFSLEDGSVIDGPAVHPAPRLEVRVRDGQIEVRKESR